MPTNSNLFDLFTDFLAFTYADPNSFLGVRGIRTVTIDINTFDGYKATLFLVPGGTSKVITYKRKTKSGQSLNTSLPCDLITASAEDGISDTLKYEKGIDRALLEAYRYANHHKGIDKIIFTIFMENGTVFTCKALEPDECTLIAVTGERNIVDEKEVIQLLEENGLEKLFPSFPLLYLALGRTCID